MKRPNLLALFALILPFLLSLACGSSGPPTIGEVITAKSLDAANKPVNPTTSYQPQDTFSVSVQVQNLIAGSIVEIQYKSDGALYHKSTMTADKAGSGYYGFSLDPPPGEFGHTSGAYTAEVYLDGALAKTISFTVEGDTTPTIVDAVLAKSLDSDNAPVNPTNTFAPTDVIGLSIKAVNLKAGAEIKVVYTFQDGQTMESSQTIKQAGSGYVGFTLSPTADGHPAGDYTVNVYLDGKPYSQTLSFTVKG